MKVSPHDIGIDESQQRKQGFFAQLREGLFGVLFVMAKDTHVVKKRHIILLFINLLQVCVGGGCIAATKRVFMQPLRDLVVVVVPVVKLQPVSLAKVGGACNHQHHSWRVFAFICSGSHEPCHEADPVLHLRGMGVLTPVMCGVGWPVLPEGRFWNHLASKGMCICGRVRRAVLS
jgi:hypothetical protein